MLFQIWRGAVVCQYILGDAQSRKKQGPRTAHFRLPTPQAARDFGAAPIRFGIEVVTPGETLRRIRT
jgi:hypothetical protein